MKKLILVCGLLVSLLSCNNDSQLEKEIAKIDIDVNVERFDLAFDDAKPSNLSNLKAAFPFMFSKYENDSIWINRMNDTLQNQLSAEVRKAFNDFDDIHLEVRSLFQHLKYYDKSFREPRIITVTSDVDYRYKTIVTDTIVLLALDTYLGSNHEFYEGIPKYISQNLNRSQLVCDLATNYSEQYIHQKSRKTLLDEMIYFGKQLYFKDVMIPFKTDADKIGYTQQQLDWAAENESYIWRYFIEKEMLFSTDNSLPNRFIALAPFSKFYLELDSESPGRLGQYIGWQIVRAYMKNNKVSLMDMMQKDAEEIFNNSNFKPSK